MSRVERQTLDFEPWALALDPRLSPLDFGPWTSGFGLEHLSQMREINGLRRFSGRDASHPSDSSHADSRNVTAREPRTVRMCCYPVLCVAICYHPLGGVMARFETEVRGRKSEVSGLKSDSICGKIIVAKSFCRIRLRVNSRPVSVSGSSRATDHASRLTCQRTTEPPGFQAVLGAIWQCG